jgi:hypothetical protein
MRAGRWIWPAALALGAGCGVFEAGNTVTGRWGGRWVLLDAMAEAEPRLDFYCSEWRFARPLVLDERGGFDGLAVAVRASWPGGAAGSLLVSGEVRGDDMSLNVIHVGPTGLRSEVAPYSLRRGANPDFSALVCLASP